MTRTAIDGYTPRLPAEESLWAGSWSVTWPVSWDLCPVSPVPAVWG